MKVLSSPPLGAVGCVGVGHLDARTYTDTQIHRLTGASSPTCDVPKEPIPRWRGGSPALNDVLASQNKLASSSPPVRGLMHSNMYVQRCWTTCLLPSAISCLLLPSLAAVPFDATTTTPLLHRSPPHAFSLHSHPCSPLPPMFSSTRHHGRRALAPSCSTPSSLGSSVADHRSPSCMSVVVE